jgi:hypothetical protein
MLTVLTQAKLMPHVSPEPRDASSKFVGVKVSGWRGTARLERRKL